MHQESSYAQKNACTACTHQKSGKAVRFSIIRGDERINLRCLWYSKGELLSWFRNITLLHVMGPSNVSSENYFIRPNRHLLSDCGAAGIVFHRHKDEVDSASSPFCNLDISLVPDAWQAKNIIVLIIQTLLRVWLHVMSGGENATRDWFWFSDLISRWKCLSKNSFCF